LSVAFAPDGKVLASGGFDGQVLLWDVTGQGPGAVPPPVASVEDLWADLAHKDARKAFRAVLRLAAMPKEAVPFLRRQLTPKGPPPPAADATTLVWLLAHLGSEKVAVREAATVLLRELGAAAEPALRKALEAGPPQEVRRCLDKLLRDLEPRPATPEELRRLRAVAVLGQIDAPEARQLLTTLAQSAPEARLRLHAQAILHYLERLRRGTP
jgi:hypothetical protein